MRANPVGWFEIYVQDLQRAQKFYEAVFQLELTPLKSPLPQMEMLTFPMEPGRMGAAGALTKMKGVASGGNSTLVYFSCEDCAVEASRIEPAGGTLRFGKTSIGEYGYIANAYDTEGNLIGLHSRH